MSNKSNRRKKRRGSSHANSGKRSSYGAVAWLVAAIAIGVLLTSRPGETLTLTLFRQGELENITIRLAAMH